MTDLKTPGIVDGDAAAQAADAALSTFSGTTGRTPLGALPDEAMVALVGDPQMAGPLGDWYRGLSAEDKQLAQSAALRTMTTFDAFAVVAEHEDGNHEYVVNESLLAALRLRRTDAGLVAQRVTQEGVSWLSYREVAPGVLLRELVSPQGYHAFMLTRAEEDEHADIVRFLGVGETSRSTGEARTVGEEQLQDPDGMSFLEGITHVTTLARELPDRGDVCVVHAAPTALYVATPGDGSVTYTPAAPDAVTALWQEWTGTLGAG